MAKRLLLIVLMLVCVGPLGAQETAVAGLHINIIVEEDDGGILSNTALRATAIVLLSAKLPEVVIDDSALLTLYIVPNCIREPNGYSCSVDVALMRINQDMSPFSNGAEMQYWDRGIVFVGPHGGARSSARDFMERVLDVPVAAWLSLDEATRKCWRDYFNANSTYRPLSPC